MTSIILATGYSISICIIAFVWGVSLREQIDELKTQRFFMEDEICYLHKELDKQKKEIKKIKGQFIWNDESEEEE